MKRWKHCEKKSRDMAYGWPAQSKSKPRGLAAAKQRDKDIDRRDKERERESRGRERKTAGQTL